MESKMVKNNSVIMWVHLFVFLALLGFSTVSFATTLTIAYEDIDSYPWYVVSGEGVDISLIKMAAKKIGVDVKFIQYPWKRCLHEVQENNVDGIFAASFKKKRMKKGVYPMAGGTYDDSKRLHMGSYSLFTLKDSTLDWDGNDFINMSGKIGVPAGYSIIEKLKEKGAEIHEARSTLQLLKMLSVGRLQGVVALTPTGDQKLALHPDLAAKIQKINIPLVQKPYFLLLSHSLVKNEPKLARDLWVAIESVRNSQAYQDMYTSFLNK